MMRWLARAVIRLAPRGWREAVARDLEEEATGGRRSDGWLAWQALCVTVRWRWTFGGEALVSDLRYAARALLCAHWFALGAAATFALGIGVNVAVFSATDRMTFRPLPYADPGRLFIVQEANPDTGETYGRLPALWAVLARGRVAGIEDLGSVGYFTAVGYALAPEPDAPVVIKLVSATHNVLQILGVTPVRGRGFTEDDARQHRPLALLSYEQWQQDFGGRDDVLEARVYRNGQPVDVVGVLPQGFMPPAAGAAQSYGLSLDDNLMQTATVRDGSYPLLVRLTPAATPQSVQAAFAPIVGEYERRLPPPPPGRNIFHPTARLTPLGDFMFGPFRNYVWVVAIAGGLVLLVACVNLAGLMLVRGRSREHETAVRVALGASTARILRAAVFEALIVAALGAGVGIGVIAASNRALRVLLPTLFVSYTEPLTDPRVVGFALLAVTASAALSGALPGVRLARVDVLPALQAVAGRLRAGRLRGGAALLAAEAAIGVILVTGAALTSRSLIGLMRTDVGFNPVDLQPVTILFPWDAHQPEATRLHQYRRALEVLRGLPGVEAAAAADVLPIEGARGNPFGGGYRGGYQQGQRWQVTDQFFRVMGMRVLAGRTFTTSEVQPAADVAVLSQRGAALVWPGIRPRDVVGRVLTFPGETPLEVIGVVSDVRSSYAAAPDPSLYVPVRTDGFKRLMYVARVQPGGAVPVSRLRDRLRQQVAEPTLVAAGDELARLRAGLRDQRFRAVLFSTFGMVGLALAAVGLYAVASFEVGVRRQELGVRLSLGARPRDLARQVLRESLKPVLLGVATGLLVSLWAARFLQVFLYQVDARDPGTYLIVAATLVATAAVAAWRPARRAAHTDPAVVLRAQ
jgi:putative ABC transport system permease protein